MRILVDICHPAHVHLFRNAIKLWKEESHEVKITIRDKDITRQLLELYNMPYVCLSKASSGMFFMGWELLRRNLRLMKLLKKWRPDVMLGMSSPTVAQVGWLKKIPSIIYTDTESGRLQNRISFPFATRICTPECYLHDVGRKQVRYKGYHELAYLHPNYFQPDASVLDELGLKSGERYTIVRFVGWKAMHDRGRKGFSREQKKVTIRRLAKLGRVFVSSEEQLPDNLEQFRFPLPFSRMHDALAFASLFLGESSTMASEAAVLGVPSVFIYPKVELGYTRQQSDQLGIVHWFTPENFSDAASTAESLLNANDVDRWQAVRQDILESSLDVTRFIVSQAKEFCDDRS